MEEEKLSKIIKKVLDDNKELDENQLVSKIANYYKNNNWSPPKDNKIKQEIWRMFHKLVIKGYPIAEVNKEKKPLLKLSLNDLNVLSNPITIEFITKFINWLNMQRPDRSYSRTDDQYLLKREYFPEENDNYLFPEKYNKQIIIESGLEEQIFPNFFCFFIFDELATAKASFEELINFEKITVRNFNGHNAWRTNLNERDRSFYNSSQVTSAQYTFHKLLRLGGSNEWQQRKFIREVTATRYKNLIMMSFAGENSNTDVLWLYDFLQNTNNPPQ